MFKKRNKNIINNRKTNITKLFIIFFCSIFLFGSISFWFQVDIGSAIDRLHTKIKRNQEVNELYGKPVVDNIYQKSLDLVQKNNISPMFEAISKTMINLNSDHNCQLDRQDIINIMYFANSSFKRDLQNNLESFEQPKRDLMWNSCNKLNVCVYNPQGWVFKNTVTSNQNCQNSVSTQFTKYYVNSYYIETIGGWNLWANYFWNYSLEDSSYDIMYDIYVLGKILFENIEEPSTTLFYKMPTINYQSIYVDPQMNMDIDWFSPYNNYTTSNNLTWNINTGISQDNNSISDNNIASPSILDNELQDFIESMSSIIWSPGLVVLGNQCVSGFEFDGLNYQNIDSTSQTISTQQYLSGVLQDISQVLCNNDGICDPWESTTCPDCISQWGNPDFEEIQDFLENLIDSDNGQINTDDPILSCYQKCQQLSCNPTNCDKLTCYAKCSCQVYSSPTYDPNINPGLTSIFQLKFCIIPVMENKITSNKIVYNIAAVFSEIYNVIQNLRNSGQLSTNVKTKEFLDTSKKDISFGDQLSFSINSNTKPVFENKSELTQTQEQIEFNNSLMETVLWFSKDSWLEREKNKYILMDDPCAYKIENQSISDPSDAARLKENCRAEREMNNIVLQTMDLESAIQDQKVLHVNSEIDDFLSKNSNFWSEISVMFSNRLDASKSFSEKWGG